MAEQAVAIRAEGLGMAFRDSGGDRVQALSELNFDVPAGRLVTLVGADGAGKTTLMRLVCGLLAPSSGRIEVLGRDVAAQTQWVQDQISYMPQKFALYEDLSVQENLDLYADLHGVPPAVRAKRYERLLAMSDLGRFTGRPAGKLSGGMKQKLGLICTLVRTPRLLLLDEPSIGVDPLSRRDLWEIVRQQVQLEHISVVWSTSYMDEAERSDYVFALHEGRLVAQGRPAELVRRAEGLTGTAWPRGGEPARDLQAALYDRGDLVLDAVPSGGAVRFIRRPGSDAPALVSLLAGRRMESRRPDFEDAFMLMISGSGEGRRAPRAGQQPVAARRPASSGPVIHVRNLVRRFGDFTAVASTSFDVKEGEIFGLLGPNGAGKTTTFRMLCGLLPATSGVIEVAGFNLRKARAEARGRIGYVAQKFALYGLLTNKENLEFFAGAYGLYGSRLRERVQAMLQQFDLRPGDVSGRLPMGPKRRLAMAAALLHEPRILFLDEPTSGIDPTTRRSFWRTITELSRTGVTVIVTTHFMEEAEYCDRIAIQDAGRFLALGTPGEVRRLAGEDCADMNSAFVRIVEKGRAGGGREK
ncbi:ATP-binding cassette domain-containing protein [Mesosutterella sp. AGMB02718]|uniref:ATP-binding cassette domain-containing protein n=1 Tax=Mesosutterella faecium TaxID=2925194 RepID=A0ABT7IMX3_9BURK|nr:ATP-binding cassette domain-containing protein [Mesosutterella sp. AGMB02718]MDL2059727.1 ATP-binding cassette domain-containing protein [Mesosutterella sp. AGMB02718]